MRILAAVVFLALSSVATHAKRFDPPREANSQKLTALLSQTTLVGVFCDPNEVDMATCKYFGRILQSTLATKHVSVPVFRYPEPNPGAQSFFVASMPFPLPTQMTLRLIEDSSLPDGKTRLWVGGFCFGHNSLTDAMAIQKQAVSQMIQQMDGNSSAQTNQKAQQPTDVSYQLPRWFEIESDTPDGSARAAGALAYELADYWLTSQKEGVNKSTLPFPASH